MARFARALRSALVMPLFAAAALNSAHWEVAAGRSRRSAGARSTRRRLPPRPRRRRSMATTRSPSSTSSAARPARCGPSRGSRSTLVRSVCPRSVTSITSSPCLHERHADHGAVAIARVDEDDRPCRRGSGGGTPRAASACRSRVRTRARTCGRVGSLTAEADDHVVVRRARSPFTPMRARAPSGRTCSSGKRIDLAALRRDDISRVPSVSAAERS